MALKITGTTVINDSRNIENITTINGTSWATVVANASAGSEVNVDELTDVTLGTLSTGEVLQYNGSAWVNTGLDFTDIASTLADAQVVESNVTQHQAALSITESQISDLGTYETADATILKDADIGVTVQAAGSYEAADATILKDADIGVNVQAYNANYVVDATYVKTDENFTTADHTKLDGIEASADVTDATNVEAAGALMDSEVTNLAQVKAFDSSDYATAAQGATADSALQSVAFGDLTTTPTTISGYGITDASTTTEMNAAISTAVGNLIDSAPTALDTLNELAASLGDDADFAGTMTTNLAGKLNLAGGALTGAVTTTSTIAGRDVAVDGTKLDGIAVNANNYVHPAAHTISEVTGLQTALDGKVDDSQVLTNVPSGALFTDTNTTYVSSDFTHDDLTGFVANEHIDWTADQGATNIHSGNYTNTTYSVGDNGLTEKNFTSTLKTKLDGIAAGATNVTNNNQLTNGAGYITSYVNTTYSAGSGLDLSGTTFSVESDLRGEVFQIGRDSNDYIAVDTTQIDFALDGSIDMRLENDGDLHVEGNVIAYSTTISDERLKKDIVKIDGALDKVAQLGGYTFEYLADGKKSAGVIAQEVEAVLPSAIVESKLPLKMGDEDETMYKTVQYDQLTGLLIEAIKELKAEIETLKG